MRIERSTFVLFASSVLLLLFALWRPIQTTVWDVTAPLGVAALHTLFALGWAIVFFSTFMIGHFDLFGLKQVWMNLQGRIRPPETEHRSHLTEPGEPYRERSEC